MKKNMKIKEAVDILEIIKAEVEWDYPINYIEALDIAIIALKEKDEFVDNNKKYDIIYYNKK